MSKIETDGFLSDEANESRTEIIATHNQEFTLARDINRLMLSLLQRLNLGSRVDADFVAGTLLVRITEGFQAVQILLERGIMPAAKVVTRTVLESYFVLAALLKRPELIERFFDQHEDSRFKALRSALQFKGEGLKQDTKKHNVERMYIEKKRAREVKMPNVLTPKEWAEAGDMHDFYNLYYVTYSSAIHSNFSALNDHWDGGDDDLNLSLGPSNKGLVDCLHCCAIVALNASQLVAEKNDVGIAAELLDLKQQVAVVHAKARI